MYQEENRKQRFITMGEIMLRLTPPDCEKSGRQIVLKRDMEEVRRMWHCLWQILG
mgnify:FL=1